MLLLLLYYYYYLPAGHAAKQRLDNSAGFLAQRRGKKTYSILLLLLYFYYLPAGRAAEKRLDNSAGFLAQRSNACFGVVEPLLVLEHLGQCCSKMSGKVVVGK